MVTGPPAQTALSEPALAVGAGLMVIVIEELTAPHGPGGSSVVSVTVALPAEISPAVGGEVAFKGVLLGAKVPAPLQVALEAAPPKEPASVVAGLLAQTV